MINHLPQLWTTAKISELCDFLKDKGRASVTPYLEIGNVSIVSKDYKLTGKPSVKGCRIAKRHDVLISKVRPTRGAITYVREEELHLSSAFTVLRNKGVMAEKYLWMFLAWNHNYLNHLGENCTGTMYPTTSDEVVVDFEIPLAPLNEQHRIVAKLEQLLAKVEACQERLNKIPAILKRFRQSVLAAACSGRLTADWREESRDNLDEWLEVLLRDVADSRLGKMLDKAKNVGKLTRYLRNLNVRWFSFELTNLVNMKVTPEEEDGLSIRNGDLFVCEGGEPGRCAVWKNGKTDIVFQKAIHRVRPDKNLSPYWLAFNIKNDAASGKLENYFTGTTIKHLTGKSLAQYQFKLPSLAEQQEIVRRIETLFKIADQIEERYKKAKAYIDKLTQSILAKAFRGDLVPQDPNDEPASVLLERIHASKNADLSNRQSLPPRKARIKR